MEKSHVTKSYCTGRIPIFKGVKVAADLLRNTCEWDKSAIIFVSPDTAQCNVRENAIADGKLLIMATPKLLDGYIKIDPLIVEGLEKEASTIEGAFKYGSKLETFPKIDMVVEGSVAVDTLGGRLGKGGGFGDREILQLNMVEAINNKTPLVTTVHESQVIKNVPIESHDQKINMIVTPERVIRINSKVD